MDIEHIFPRTPSDEVLRGFDRRDEIAVHVRRLGNLALLEKSINSSIGADDFQSKRAAYRQSQYLLTKSLGEKISVGKNTAIDRAVAELVHRM